MYTLNSFYAFMPFSILFYNVISLNKFIHFLNNTWKILQPVALPSAGKMQVSSINISFFHRLLLIFFKYTFIIKHDITL